MPTSDLPSAPRSTPQNDDSLSPQDHQNEPISSIPHAQDPHGDPGRVLVLCFDGTGNKFGEYSNVLRLYRAAKKDDRKHQVVYYQPGIGTYNKKSFFLETLNTIFAGLDAAVALNLDDHVKDGYLYLIQNYRPGDKICLFGFSRGAHTARVVAGMIYKVGILPKENLQMVDFAFSIYTTTGYRGYKLSQEFKSTYSSHVEIDFVGVWDTVSSVGIIPQTHPYTSINYSTKYFRHALALDERRARFRPNVWNEVTLNREQELDVDLPDPVENFSSIRDRWKYTPPDRNHADVKEVWFAGSHSDVGGGSHSTQRLNSLSYIPLRWIIKECILAKTGIQFDLAYLRDSFDFDFHGLVTEMKEKNVTIKDLGEGYRDIERYAEESLKKEQAHSKPAVANCSCSCPCHRSAETYSNRIRRYINDILDETFDQLILVWFWWILEFIPMLSSSQEPKGNWIRVRTRNFGRGRYIPFFEDKILVHNTVKTRIEETNYKPNAYNWETVMESPMLQWVS